MSKELYKEIELELERYKKENKRLEAELEKVKQVIKDNELEEELTDVEFLSPEEQICIDGIKHLAKLFETGAFTKDDSSMFDILHKNLRLIRGHKDPKEKKSKPKNKAELFKIVEGLDAKKK